MVLCCASGNEQVAGRRCEPRTRRLRGPLSRPLPPRKLLPAPFES
jgi:hypothetical protein